MLTFDYTNTGPGAWSYSVTIPATDVGGAGNPVVVKNGNLTFDGSGHLTAPAADVTGITVGIPNTAALADGAAAADF